MRSVEATATVALLLALNVAAFAATQIVRGPDHGYVGYVDRIGIFGSKKALQIGGKADVRRSQSLLVSGWAANGMKRPASSVYPIIDGRVMSGVKVTLGLPRPDVAKAVGADLQSAGYLARIPLRSLQPGVHTFEMGQALISGPIAVLHGAITLVVH